jgi:hypothetical protein
VDFDKHFDSALSYTLKSFSDALALLPDHTPKPLSNDVIESTGDDTNPPPPLEEGMKIM